MHVARKGLIVDCYQPLSCYVNCLVEVSVKVLLVLFRLPSELICVVLSTFLLQGPVTIATLICVNTIGDFTQFVLCHK